MSVAEVTQNPEPPQAKKPKPVPVAHIATHFNIYRNIHDAHDGPVTIDEQVKAIERFVRWHQRQVEIGQKLLAQLQAVAATIAKAQGR